MSRGFWCARSLGKLGLCTLGPCLGQSTLVALLLLGKEPAPVAGRQGLGTAALAGFRAGHEKDEGTALIL
jgi:hypothetical protein